MPSPQRNGTCPCGSGKKYKKCCRGNFASAPHDWRADRERLVASGCEQQREAVEEELARLGKTALAVLTIAVSGHSIASSGIEGTMKMAKPACRPGCSFCCTIPVAVQAPEAFALAAFVRHTMNEDQGVDLVSRLRTHTRQTALFATADEHTNSKVPCSLLTPQGRCSAYIARPIACRAHCSLSRERCAEAILSPEPAKATVPVNARAKLIGLGVSEGLSVGLKRAGLDAKTYELNSALLRALETPDGAARWIGGEDIFAGCKTYSGAATAAIGQMTPKALGTTSASI